MKYIDEYWLPKYGKRIKKSKVPLTKKLVKEWFPRDSIEFRREYARRRNWGIPYTYEQAIWLEPIVKNLKFVWLSIEEKRKYFRNKYIERKIKKWTIAYDSAIKKIQRIREEQNIIL